MCFALTTGLNGQIKERYGDHKMNKEDIIRKLTSRKLWMAIALFVSGLMTALGKDAGQAETVAGLIMQLAAVVAYIVGEGLVDAGRSGEDEDEIYCIEDSEDSEAE